jgi:alpha-mannosidase
MTYSLLPGASVADAVEGGYALNLPLRVVDGTAAEPTAPLATLDGQAAAIEAVKLADDRSGDVIVRLYESLGGRAATTLRPGFPVAQAHVTDLLERPMADEQPIEPDADGGIAVNLRPFQVLTLRLTPGTPCA